MPTTSVIPLKGMAAENIDSDQYVDGSIDTAHIATNQIDETLIKDAFVADFTEVVVASGDSLLFGDTSDSGATKRDTIQGIIDLTATAIDINAMQANIALNFFLESIDHSRSVLNMHDGWVDQFEDQTGVDDTNSLNETYDSSNDLYHNPGSSSSAWVTGDRTSSITVTLSFAHAGTAANMVDGDFTAGAGGGIAVSGTPAASGGSWKFDFGSGNATLISEAKFYQGATQSHGVWKWQGSNDDISYTDIGSSFTLTSSGTSATSHTSLNGNSTEYRYYKLLGVSGTMANTQWVTEFEFYVTTTTVTGNIMLMSEPVVALAAPSDVHVSIFKQDVDAVTVNTDLIAWVSRSKQTVTADTSTDEKLDASTHGLENDDRVIITSSSGDVPAGSSQDVVYFVVNKTTNDFEIALTSGGAAVNLTDNGSGTHSIHAVTQVTLVDEGTYSTYDIYAGSVDISSQPSDTDMVLFVQTANTKEMKLHGMALQWS